MCQNRFPQTDEEVLDWINRQVDAMGVEAVTMRQLLRELCRSLFFEDRIVTLPRFGFQLWVGVTQTRRVAPPINEDDVKTSILEQIYCWVPPDHRERLNALIDADGRDAVNNALPIHPERVAYVFAGGQLFDRWTLHQIYDARFPLCPDEPKFDPLEDEKHFTQSAGLCAVHPMVESIWHDYAKVICPILALRSFRVFGYDPTGCFSGGRQTPMGFYPKNPPAPVFDEPH